MLPSVNPKYRHHCETCTCLGQVTMHGVTADLFVCDETVMARTGDGPDDYRASHVKSLSIWSDSFLLAAFRVCVDTRGGFARYRPLISPSWLQS